LNTNFFSRTRDIGNGAYSTKSYMPALSFGANSWGSYEVDMKKLDQDMKKLQAEISKIVEDANQWSKLDFSNWNAPVLPQIPVPPVYSEGTPAHSVAAPVAALPEVASPPAPVAPVKDANDADLLAAASQWTQDFRGDGVVRTGGTGGTGNYRLFGTGRSDRLEGGMGNDKLYGEAGDDRLYGGMGNDKLYGGDGADRLKGGMDNDRLYGDAGNDLLEGDMGNDVLDGGTGNDRLDGGMDNDALSGGQGHDRLNGGMGNDRLEGGAGKDTYVFDKSFGQDVIRNGDAAGHDEVVFSEASEAKANRMWFSRKGNDLELTVLDSNKSTGFNFIGGDVSMNNGVFNMNNGVLTIDGEPAGSSLVNTVGDADKITLSNWYGSAEARVDLFRDAAGQTLKASQVDNLVNAMAAFGAIPAGSESLTQQQWKTLDTVIAANWA